MQAVPPSYRTRSGQFEIDRCEPQRRAIQCGTLEFHGLSNGHYPGQVIPKGVVPGLSSVGFWNARSPQDWGLEDHRNEGVEIMFLETGSMVFVADGRGYNLQAGNFTITRPWQLHRLGSPNIEPSRLHWLILDVGVRRPHQKWEWPKWLVLTKADLEELAHRLRHTDTPVWSATPALAASFRDIAECVVGWGQPHSISLLASTLNLMLVRLLETLSRQSFVEDKSLVSPKRAVEIFLADVEAGRIDLSESWPLQRMAEYCGLGKSTLSKYCMERANVGPVEFLARCRLERAARQLRDAPTMTVTEVALANGFNSSQYFATAFARQFKTNPTAYRQRLGK